MNYIMSDNSPWNRVFARAVGLGASASNSDRVCARCGSTYCVPNGGFDVTVEGGAEFPDVLGCGFYPFLVFSRRAVDALRENGIDQFEAFPVGVAEIRSKKLAGVQVPDYFRVELTEDVEIDLAASGIVVEKYCPECGSLEFRPTIPPKLVLVEGSWGNAQVFRNSRYFPRVYFCTDLVVSIATHYRLTNFRFTSIDQPFSSIDPGIPYLA